MVFERLRRSFLHESYPCDACARSLSTALRKSLAGRVSVSVSVSSSSSSVVVVLALVLGSGSSARTRTQDEDEDDRSRPDGNRGRCVFTVDLPRMPPP